MNPTTVFYFIMGVWIVVTALIAYQQTVTSVLLNSTTVKNKFKEIKDEELPPLVKRWNVNIIGGFSIFVTIVWYLYIIMLIRNTYMHGRILNIFLQ